MTVQINGTTGVTTPGLTTDTSVANTSSTLTGEPVTRIKTYTAQATTSGTFVDSPAIPSWAKRITVLFDSVSTNGTGVLLVQLGSGSIQTTSYRSTSSGLSNGATNSILSVTNGFNTSDGGNAAHTNIGTMVLTLLPTNRWLMNYNGSKDTGLLNSATGIVQLSGVLDKIRLTNGAADTFDSGSITIIVEG